MMASNTWTCEICTFGANKPLTSQCEVCGSMKSFYRENSPPSYPDAPPLPPLEKEKFESTPQQYVSPNNSNSAANANGIWENKATDIMEIDKNTNTNTIHNKKEMETHPNQEEINMIFHQNANPETETSKKWNCLICTLENDAQNNTCIACNGPSVLKNDLWGKRICRKCYTINNTNTTNCNNCKHILTEIVDYDKNFNLIIKVTDNKKDIKSYNNNHNMNHHKYPSYNNGYNNHYANKQQTSNPLHTNPFHKNPYNNNYNKCYSKQQEQLHKKNKKKHHFWDYNSNPNINNNTTNSNNTMNNNNNHISSGFDSVFGSFGIFGGIFGGMNQNDNKQQNENEIPRVNVKQEYDKAMKTNEIARLRLIRRRQFVENDDGDAHFRICESQFMRSNQKNMQFNHIHAHMHANGQQLNKTIQEVEYVINPKLINKFEAKKKHLMNKYGYDSESKLNIVLAWHGTAKQNVNGIVQNNFDLSRLSSGSGDTGWYGSGIYFSEFASISSGYGASLLLCKVILGKAYRMKSQQKQTGRGLQNGYDSHVVVGHNNNQYGQEIVIFDVDQILPCYIVKY